MNKDKINISKITLKLLEKKLWNKISLEEVKKLNKNSLSIKNKNQLLENINRYFDYLLKNNLNSIESSSSKDMIFEVLMARFDILNKYRKSIKNLAKYIKSNPHKFIITLPSFIESIIVISNLANININGVKGSLKIKAIFIIYVLSTFTWLEDESKSLEKTMTVLDKYLNQLDKITNIL